MEESSRDMPWLSPILPVHCYLFLLSSDIGTSGWLNGPLGTYLVAWLKMIGRILSPASLLC